MQEPMPGILRGDTWKDISVCYFEVEKGGILSLSDLYMYIYSWFVKEQMKHWSGDTKFEDFYLHRIRPDGVQENLIWWRGYRPVNAYLTYVCKMDWQNFGSKPTEVLYDEKKVKADKLGIVLRVWWWVQVDPANKWDKSFVSKLMGGKFQKWFYEYLLNNELENHVDKCRELAKRQENEIKEFFEMSTSEPMPRAWFPEEGYKWKKPKPSPEAFTRMDRAPDREF